MHGHLIAHSFMTTQGLQTVSCGGVWESGCEEPFIVHRPIQLLRGQGDRGVDV